MAVAARRTYSLRTYLIGDDVIASGGVREIADIKKLAETGVEAAIIGRALYEGTLKLADAINAAN